MRDYLHRKYANHFLKPFLGWYLKKPRRFKHGTLSLNIYPGVFHPAYFFSTAYLAEFISELELNGKTVAEVGAGSGLLSFLCVQQGALVSAIELNEIAVKGLIENAERNNMAETVFRVFHSDIFDAVPGQVFDVILINPPYFFKDVGSPADLAWNCGSKGEYFEKLFCQLKDYASTHSAIFMSLAENCDIERIKAIANKSGATLELTREKKIKWEKNFIFKVKYE